jgi:hypothetical protein
MDVIGSLIILQMHYGDDMYEAAIALLPVKTPSPPMSCFFHVQSVETTTTTRLKTSGVGLQNGTPVIR